MSVNPTGADLKRYLAEDPGGPVVMLNLLKYREDGGEAEYKTYVEGFGRFAERYGAEVVFLGDCSTVLAAPDTHDWDAVLLVRYPTRRAFCDMVADEEYQQITGIRTGALTSAVLQATIPWPAA